MNNLKICREVEKETQAFPGLYKKKLEPLPDSFQILLDPDVLEFLENELEGMIDNLPEMHEIYTEKEIDELYKVANKTQEAIQKLIKEETKGTHRGKPARISRT